jgi:hypothetical protein
MSKLYFAKAINQLFGLAGGCQVAGWSPQREAKKRERRGRAARRYVEIIVISHNSPRWLCYRAAGASGVGGCAIRAAGARGGWRLRYPSSWCRQESVAGALSARLKRPVVTAMLAGGASGCAIERLGRAAGAVGGAKTRKKSARADFLAVGRLLQADWLVATTAVRSPHLCPRISWNRRTALR